MSNNPFLKSRESNNRFQFLDDPTVNNHTTNDKKTANTYVSSEKSFTKPPNRRPTNNFKNRREPEKIKHVEINVETEYFPDLVPNKKISDKSITDSTKFKDILTTQLEEIVIIGNNIRPGWVEISRTKTNTKSNYNIGPPSPYKFQRQKLEKTPNYVMSKAIESMKYNWDKYKAEYDSINGDGAYDEKYTLPPVYGPDYDSYDDSYEDDDSYDSENDSYSYDENDN